uniref:Uncharacterized protein n=1 Tax=Magallana gigas TaxID=29159 RepID=K1PB63_MAGGI
MVLMRLFCDRETELDVSHVFVNATKCDESAATAKIVKSCPQNHKEWSKAAARKGCEKMAHSCLSFEYHCHHHQCVCGRIVLQSEGSKMTTPEPAIRNVEEGLEEWKEAAARKGCEKMTCSSFEYHCVINAWGNETIEVCAPRLLIIDVGIDLQTCKNEQVIRLALDSVI